jgi:hypothetical protein
VEKGVEKGDIVNYRPGGNWAMQNSFLRMPRKRILYIPDGFGDGTGWLNCSKDQEKPLKAKPRKPEQDRTVLWILVAAGGGALVIVVIAGVGLILYFALRGDNSSAKGTSEMAVPTRAAPTKNSPPAHAGNSVAFKEMADRLVGRWLGELPQGGTVVYHYRADGSFTIEVQRPGNPLTVNGTWRVVGIGADSLSIERKGSDPPSEFFTPGDRPIILFPAPGLMQHSFQKGALQFALEGSGLKPGQMPTPNERQQAVSALQALGAQVIQDAGFDGRVWCVNFTPNSVSDADLELLKPLTGITAVRLTGCTQVTDAGLVHLLGLTKLQALAIDGTQVTDAGLVHLKGMKELIGLECGAANIHGEGLVHLQALPKLNSLHLNKSGITDAGMVHVGQLTKLVFVDLNDTGITDKGLAHLHGCAKLSVVRLRRTLVTEAGVQALKKAVPKVRVEQ